MGTSTWYSTASERCVSNNFFRHLLDDSQTFYSTQVSGPHPWFKNTVELLIIHNHPYEHSSKLQLSLIHTQPLSWFQQDQYLVEYNVDVGQMIMCCAFMTDKHRAIQIKIKKFVVCHYSGHPVHLGWFHWKRCRIHVSYRLHPAASDQCNHCKLFILYVFTEAETELLLKRFPTSSVSSLIISCLTPWRAFGHQKLAPISMDRQLPDGDWSTKASHVRSTNHLLNHRT